MQDIRLKSKTTLLNDSRIIPEGTRRRLIADPRFRPLIDGLVVAWEQTERVRGGDDAMRSVLEILNTAMGILREAQDEQHPSYRDLAAVRTAYKLLQDLVLVIRAAHDEPGPSGGN